MPANVRAACIMGWPVGHSRSPLIHGYWLKRHAIEGEYRREGVRPEDFPAFLKGLGARGYVGGNVTIPLKEIAFACTEPDEAARAIGAVNTVWYEGETLRSTNTDVEGFLGNLDEAAPGWSDEAGRACVVGAGGAARAVIFGLLGRGFDRIDLVNRSPAKAEALARQFGPAVRAAGWSGIGKAMEGAKLFVNASPLGMGGQAWPELDLRGLGKDCVVSDLVYVPMRTTLIEDAEAAGFRVVGGLGMLLHQAGSGFERWFGVRPSLTAELRALVEAEILADDAKHKQPEQKPS